MKNIQVLTLTIFCIFVFFVMPGVAANLKGKIGVINAQQLVSESKLGKDASQELESNFGPKKSALDKSVAAYREKEAAFQKKMAALSAKAREEQGKALLEERNALAQKTEQLSKDFQKDEQALREKLLKAIVKASEVIAKKLGLVMVLDGTQAGVLYLEDGYDVTQEVLKEMDKDYKK